MKNNKLQIVNYNQAQRLKAAGFDWDTVSHFYTELHSDIVEINPFTIQKYQHHEIFFAPSVALALKWMRDVKGLFGYVIFNRETFSKGYWWYYFSFSDKTISKGCEISFIKSTYEAAESALLDELLTILEKEV